MRSTVMVTAMAANYTLQISSFSNVYVSHAVMTR
jgi:hypothetical protein